LAPTINLAGVGMDASMSITPSIKHRVVLGFWLLVLWTAIADLFAIQWHTYDSLHGRPWPWNQYIRWNLEQWYAWGALSPLVLWLAAKQPIAPQRIWRTLPLHLLASVLTAAIAICIQAVLSHFMNTDNETVRYYVELYLSKDVAISIATYWGLTGFAQTLSYYRENGKRQLRETQLERQLAQSQLQVLQMQLHPHFLFNTLHAIGTLIYDDPASAEQMLLDLSSLLRVFVEGHSSQEIPLARELNLVELYLSIQQIRFRDRLTIQSHVALETHDYSVPSLLLQPIVENAIVHGIAKNLGKDIIEITSSLQDGTLVLEVINHNSVLSEGICSDGSGFRVGLSNTRQRLAQMYNGAAALSIFGREPLGVVCRITMPAVKTASRPLSEEEALSL
jgi:two-component system, LytTR family, sensor kinase